MLEKYTSLVTAIKSLTQASAITSQPDKTLMVGENEWDRRPNADSYGKIQYEFEAGSLDGDNLKKDRAYEGSIDLYSTKRNGEGWPALIEQVLEEHCDSCWRLNYHTYETNTSLFHWEWVFQIEG